MSSILSTPGGVSPVSSVLNIPGGDDSEEGLRSRPADGSDDELCEELSEAVEGADVTPCEMWRLEEGLLPGAFCCRAGGADWATDGYWIVDGSRGLGLALSSKPVG